MRPSRRPPKTDNPIFFKKSTTPLSRAAMVCLAFFVTISMVLPAWTGAFQERGETVCKDTLLPFALSCQETCGPEIFKVTVTETACCLPEQCPASLPLTVPAGCCCSRPVPETTPFTAPSVQKKFQRPLSSFMATPAATGFQDTPSASRTILCENVPDTPLISRATIVLII